MKVADILDKIANANGLIDALHEAMESKASIGGPLDDHSKVSIEETVADDILELICEYIGILEDKDVK